jgi:hypothetical protein
MTRRARIALFGGCGVLVVVGIVCAVVVSGVLAAVLAFVFIATGMVLATSLVFLEVGLSEDRERERELAKAKLAEAKRRAARRRPRLRIPRVRGHGPR